MPSAAHLMLRAFVASGANSVQAREELAADIRGCPGNWKLTVNALRELDKTAGDEALHFCKAVSTAT